MPIQPHKIKNMDQLKKIMNKAKKLELTS
jgi:hypothetical protein